MKKIFLIAIVLIAANTLNAKRLIWYDYTYNEYANDVYFANGIMTDELSAKKTIRRLKYIFTLSYPLEAKDIINWQAAYNHTHGLGIDLYESGLQKIDEHLTTRITWWVLDLLDWSLKGIAKRVAMKLGKKAIGNFAKKQSRKIAIKIVRLYGDRYGKVYIKGVPFDKKDIEDMINHIFEEVADEGIDAYMSKSEDDIKEESEKDLEIQFNQYIKSIRDGHHVIVIAHSQGNLYTNQSFEMLEDHIIPFEEDTVWFRRFFSAIAVASPADNILGKEEPHVTFDNDIITLVPNHLEWNIENPTRYYCCINAVGEKVENIWSLEAHYFLESYMTNSEASAKILSFVKKTITNNRNLSSQWNIKEKSGDTCKEKYIKITHKYNPDKMDDWNFMGHNHVLDFSGTKPGKIYSFYDSTFNEEVYVLAQDGGKYIEEVNYDNTCYVLKDFDGNIVGKITGQGTNDNGDDTGGDSDDDGDDDSSTGGDDNNTTDDPTQDPNKVCVSNYFKYYGDGKIHDSLKKGDKDAELYSDGTKHQVKEMQEFLQAFGYNVGSSGTDGWFSSDTKDALIAFQDANGLDADGIVGPNTRKAMNNQNCYDK